MQKPYLIGTRGSLLAVTQCTLAKNEMEHITGKSFELKKIKTQGDQITDKPLWQLEGKDFFTKELDAALLKNEVDLVIHSYKDLGSERPQGISLGAITQRKYPHDILLIPKKLTKELNHKAEITIGTSSPRRIVNITSSLGKYLPNSQTKINCKTLRGNINTRIEKLLSGEYDGIVLALAGLERLASFPSSAQVLKDLVKDLNFMILPTLDFPPSASQGALAIEYNQESEKEILPHLKSIHHGPTAENITKERNAFHSYGGGCHLAVGIHVKDVHGFKIHIHKGSVDDKKVNILNLEGENYSSLKGKSIYHVKGENDFLIKRNPIKNHLNSLNNLFVTSSHCFHHLENSNSLWAAGNQTMKKLIKIGHWVCGSAEGFGHEEILNFKNSNAVKILLQNENWLTLTHFEGESIVSKTLGVYENIIQKAPPLPMNLKQADIIFWSSSIQYQNYIEAYPELKGKIHACGLGKTYPKLKELGASPLACIDYQHLKESLEG